MCVLKNNKDPQSFYSYRPITYRIGVIMEYHEFGFRAVLVLGMHLQFSCLFWRGMKE